MLDSKVIFKSVIDPDDTGKNGFSVNGRVKSREAGGNECNVPFPLEQRVCGIQGGINLTPHRYQSCSHPPPINYTHFSLLSRTVFSTFFLCRDLEEALL